MDRDGSERPQPTLTTSQLAVYDDLLSPEQFNRLLVFIEAQEYRSVHADVVKDVWRPEDGVPLAREKSFVWSAPALSSLLLRGASEAPAGADVHPTGTPMDPLLETVSALAAGHAELLGDARSWLAMAARIYAYPAGSALSWHDDARTYAGSFVFYAHPTWSAQWGGELLVADPESAAAFRAIADRERGSDTRRHRKHFFGGRDPFDEALSARGLGQFVAPRPNRLVILAGGQPHMLARVSPAAGNHCRLSVAGFFLTPLAITDLARTLHRPSASK